MRTWTFERFGVVKQLADDPFVVMCDYDRRRDWPRVRSLRARVNRLGLKLRWFSQELSGSGRGYHLVAAFADPMTKIERAFVQLYLGSDSNREGLNFYRARSLNAWPSRFWESRWNLLFSRKLT